MAKRRRDYVHLIQAQVVFYLVTLGAQVHQVGIPLDASSGIATVVHMEGPGSSVAAFARCASAPACSCTAFLPPFSSQVVGVG
jgi:hypothetical protein